ncbi:signal recognition particle subunit SRP72-like isoform X3 [Zophobas morio]|uniref:signal recognition particle subunit SRP72-like isoform X3 n=1 Tax=Zophobas morio TaxID=2755281 RepID=UPI003083BF6B
MSGRITSGNIKNLRLYLHNSDYDSFLELCSQLRKEYPDRLEIYKLEVSCLIGLGKFQEALSVIQTSKAESSFEFHSAYCLYRLLRTDEALALISEDPLENNFLLLKAQLYYRKGDYLKALRTYEILDLKLNSGVNFTASIALSESPWSYCLSTEKKFMELNFSSSCYEQCFNLACLFMWRKKLPEALNYLQKSYQLCSALPLSDGFSRKDQDYELLSITLQIAIVHHLAHTDSPADVYRRILDSNVAGDDVLILVAEANLRVLERTRPLSLSESIRLGASSNLSVFQSAILKINFARQLYYDQRFLDCRQECQELCKEFTAWVDPILLKVSALLASHEETAALTFLEASVGRLSSVECLLALCQIHAKTGSFQRAIELLEFPPFVLPSEAGPGISAALVSLYRSAKKWDAAVEVLTRLNASTSEAHRLEDVRLVLGHVYYSKEEYESAYSCYEEVFLVNRSNTKALASLILTCQKFDDERAELLAEQLPDKPIDSQAIEKLLLDMTSCLQRKKNNARSKRKRSKPNRASPIQNQEMWMPKRRRPSSSKSRVGSKDKSKPNHVVSKVNRRRSRK